MSLKNFQEAEQRLIEKIRSVKQHPTIKPPYKYVGANDPLSILLGFAIKEQKLDYEYGLYIANPTTSDKPQIIIDPNGSDKERLNFTYFHEVSHHLIRSDGELYEFLDELATQGGDFKTLKDLFANIGAAEYLLPRGDVKELIDTKSFSIKLLLDLDQKYPASKPAIAIQLARQAIHKCFVVICEYGILPQKDEGQIGLPTEPKQAVETNHLYIRYSSSSPTNKYTIGRYTIIPKNHILRKIYEEKLEYSKGVDNIPFRSGKEWQVPCEGLYYKGKVYGVFNIEPPPPPDALQPKLF